MTVLLTARGRHGVVTAPHRLASEAGLAILREGGNAVEAALAIAAMLAVVYPHMNGIGGDGFWLIAEPGRPPVGIRAGGRAGSAVDEALYRARGLAAIPTRGPLAANTVAGTVDGWRLALDAARAAGGRLPLDRLLADAIRHAEDGFPVSASQRGLAIEFFDELATQRGFAATFLDGGAAPAIGTTFRQPRLATTLRRIATDGPEGFYRGALAAEVAADLRDAGSPLTGDDLAAYRADACTPLSVEIPGATLFNLPPPTQGAASLMILAIFARLGVTKADGFDHIHGLVEATKQAFLIRDTEIGDPGRSGEVGRHFAPERIAAMAAAIDPKRALPWPAPPAKGDTVWLGVIDGEGRAVSMIQSLYFEYGSGVVLPRTGILWQNRGSAFRLGDPGPRGLRPGAIPFHTLNPALARFANGDAMAYGSMGGDGQPQFQAAVFSRAALFGQDLQEAVSAPRWLLGRTWGKESTTLKLETGLDPALGARLAAAGHAVEWAPRLSHGFGHAGAVVRRADGGLEGASDPRSDGAALAF